LPIHPLTKMRFNYLLTVLITFFLILSVSVAHPVNENSGDSPLVRRTPVPNWFNNLKIVKFINKIKERQQQMDNILNSN